MVQFGKWLVFKKGFSASIGDFHPFFTLNHGAMGGFRCMNQVIQAVTFWSPNVGGHFSPLKRVTFSPSQKGHELNHQGMVDFFQRSNVESSRQSLEVCQRISKFPVLKATLQGIDISHLGKRKIIVKMPFWGDMLVPWRLNKNHSFWWCQQSPTGHQITQQAWEQWGGGVGILQNPLSVDLGTPRKPRRVICNPPKWQIRKWKWGVDNFKLSGYFLEQTCEMWIHPLIFVFAASKVHSASDFPEMSVKEIFIMNWVVATQIFLEFSPRNLGEDEPILTHNIFFNWVGSTTN